MTVSESDWKGITMQSKPECSAGFGTWKSMDSKRTAKRVMI